MYDYPSSTWTCPLQITFYSIMQKKKKKKIEKNNKQRKGEEYWSCTYLELVVSYYSNMVWCTQFLQIILMISNATNAYCIHVSVKKSVINNDAVHINCPDAYLNFPLIRAQQLPMKKARSTRAASQPPITYLLKGLRDNQLHPENLFPDTIIFHFFALKTKLFSISSLFKKPKKKKFNLDEPRLTHKFTRYLLTICHFKFIQYQKMNIIILFFKQ